MKIALIGPHGTGKTTIAHELIVKLKKDGKNVEYLGEIARQCPFPINKNITKNAQEWIIFFQHIKELELKDKTDIIICDRSILDGYTYYYYLFGKNQLLENFIKEKIKDYDLLIKVPIREGYLKDDGVRDISKRFQEDIEIKFQELLKELNIPYQDYENLDRIIEIIK
ncbi:hypothetical protein CMI40_02035 [Candidatus Pacearchaeota archaeon]|jgi:nicotinamide riboside kinase|nr:hypothetical protein [Candidatus Pacearchaeota archaeon]|tara:strand:+ start:11754 stop:12257 length:504 start_codon:yes stop_codon:yes gene_type:complete